MARTCSRIRDEDLQQLKEEMAISEVCRLRGIELTKHGSKDLIGLCPFHDDEKPSFIVSPAKNLFHCMGCGEAGSVIDLVIKLDGVPFREAVGRLSDAMATVRKKKVFVPEDRNQIRISPERTRKLLERVVDVYEKAFEESPKGLAFLEKRGLKEGGLFAPYRIGFSDGRLTEMLPGDERLKKELYALGILLESGRERFAGCVVVPVFDANGLLTTLYGRFTGGGNKRHVFLPNRPKGVWNASAMKNYPDLILVESVIDALSVMSAGFPHVMAVQGTHGLNDEQIRSMREAGAQSVTLLLDGDEAGKTAAKRLKEKLDSSFSCSLITLPGDHDPNSYLQAFGSEGLAEFLQVAAESGSEPSTVRAGGGAERTPAISSDGTVFRVACGLRRYEVRGLEKGARKLKATVRVEHAGRLHVDTLDFYSARARRQLAQSLCRLFDEPAETIEADLQRLIVECERCNLNEVAAREAVAPAVEISPRERADAEAFGRSPDLVEQILSDFETCGLIGEKSNTLLGYIAMTSRRRDVPLSLLILSSSGAGKTALQDAVLAFCPPEDLVKLTSLSGKALFYKEQSSLKHKVLALEEGDGAQDASYAIRNLISAGELVSESTIKDLATGRLVTMENRVEGPTSVFLTTTNPEIDAETKSRFFVTSIDESREQTRQILVFQRERHCAAGPMENAEREAVLKRHHTFQRLLKPLAVRNPYARQLTYGDDRLQGRRDQPKYLNLIKAIAFLRQMQKEIHFEERDGQAVEAVDVEMRDIELANRLAHEVLGHSLDELSRPARDLLITLAEMVKERLALNEEKRGGDERPADVLFTRREIREFTGWTNTRLHIHLKELVDFEYLLVESGRNGLPFRYRLAYEGQGQDGRKFVLGLKTPEGES